MAKINYVVAGDYEGWDFGSTSHLGGFCCIRRCGAFFEKERIDLNKQTVQEYNIIDKSTNNSFSLMYGVLGKSNTYLIDVKFSDNKKALICADENSFKHFMSVMY